MRLFSALMFAIASVLVTLGVPAPSDAHPFHVSIAEVEWNPETKSLEIALRLWPTDLETALRKSTGKRIDLDKSPDVDELSAAYLAHKLRFLPAADLVEKDAPSTDVNAKEIVAKETVGKPDSIQPIPIKWVGRRTTIKEVWLFFEVPLADPATQLTIDNELLFELLPDQQNTMVFKHNGKRTTLTFRKDQPRQSITLGAVAP